MCIQNHKKMLEIPDVLTISMTLSIKKIHIILLITDQLLMFRQISSQQ